MLIKHTIDIRLNSAGFKGADVDALLPDFITDRETSVGLTWYPSANGPESFSVLLTVYAALSIVAGEFLKKLGEDLYQWSKQKLLNILKAKTYPSCYIEIKLDDVKVYFYDETLFDHPDAGEVILSVFETLPSLLRLVDVEQSKTWVIYRDGLGGPLLITSEESRYAETIRRDQSSESNDSTDVTHSKSS